MRPDLRGWGIFIGAIMGLLAASITAQVYVYLDHFGKTSRISFKDETETDAPIQTLEFGVFLPGQDPRLAPAPPAQRLFTVSAGAALALAPVLAGLSPGTYLVFCHVPNGPWSEGREVYIDLAEPAKTKAELSK